MAVTAKFSELPISHCLDHQENGNREAAIAIIGVSVLRQPFEKKIVLDTWA